MKPIKEYQEAVNYLKGYYDYEIDKEYAKKINTIQELIYEYELVCKQLFFMKTEYDKLKKKYDDLKDDYIIARAYAINNILKGDRNDK